MDEETVETPVIPETPDVEIDANDTDALEYQAALAELKAEEKVEEVTEEVAADDNANTEIPVVPASVSKEFEAATPKVNEEEAVDESQPAIPKSRFDQVLRERDEYKTKATFAEGKLEALQKPQAPQQETRQNPTPQDAIAFVRSKVDEAAQKFDEGELSMAEFKRFENQANDRIDQIKFEAQESQRQSEPQTPQVNIPEEIKKENFIQSLEEKYPYSKDGVIKGEQRWALIKSEAAQKLANEGVSNPNHSQFLEAIAKKANEYGPMWVGTLPGTTQPTVQKSDIPKSRAKEVGAKLDLLAQHPENIGELGSSGITEGWTDAKIDAMTEEEYDALPEATRERLLNGTG